MHGRKSLALQSRVDGMVDELKEPMREASIADLVCYSR